MPYVIKDENTGHYFTRTITPSGWFNPDINRARLYTSDTFAKRVIEIGDHHVAYPYNRKLKAVRISLKEETND
jgi:hypothetical protein